jgi:hypothetical protein
LNVLFTETDKDGNAVEGGVSKENSVLLKYFTPKMQKELMGKKMADCIVFQLGKTFEGDKLEMMLHDLGFDKNDKDAYKKGASAMFAFFEKTKDKNFKYLPNDFKYNGLLLSKSGQDSLGVIEIERAITLDSVINCELWGDIGKVWVKAKRYQKAIVSFNNKSRCTKGLTGQDQ